MAATFMGVGMEVPEREWKAAEEGGKSVEMSVCGDVGERKSAIEEDEREASVEGVKGGEGVGGLERVEGSELITLDRERVGRTIRGRGSGGGGGLWEGKLVAIVAGAVGAAETVCKQV